MWEYERIESERATSCACVTVLEIILSMKRDLAMCAYPCNHSSLFGLSDGDKVRGFVRQMHHFLVYHMLHVRCLPCIRAVEPHARVHAILRSGKRLGWGTELVSLISVSMILSNRAAFGMISSSST
jgi:hypothetical protein